MEQAVSRPEWRKLRILIAVTLIVLTAQGWTGDTANLFVTTYTASAGNSIAGAFHIIAAAGSILVWHAAEGVLVFALSLGVLALSLRAKAKSIRICAILGTFMVVSAGIGGLLFVLSGFRHTPPARPKWGEASSAPTPSTSSSCITPSSFSLPAAQTRLTSLFFGFVMTDKSRGYRADMAFDCQTTPR
jgi:hypothetical protein